MPTIHDVARAAGVSKSTASRALGHPELVAAATTERVLQAAREMGYVPNRAARGLARGRAGIVALVVPTLANAFFTPIIGGVQTRATEDDLQLTVAVNTLDSDTEVRRFERLAREVDGLIIVAPRGTDQTVTQVAGMKPTILVDRELDGVGSVVADTASAFAELLTGLADAGHKRVLYLSGPGQSWQDRQRQQAVREAAERRGITLDTVGPYLPTFEAGASTLETALQSRASVVLSYATDLGIGLLLSLQHAGRASWSMYPASDGRLAVAGIPGTPMVDVDGAQLGRQAMDRLSSLVADPDQPVVAEQLPVPVAWPAS